MAKQAQNQNRVCAVGWHSQSWAQVCKASQASLRGRGMCPWTAHFYKFPGVSFIPWCLELVI